MFLGSLRGFFNADITINVAGLGESLSYFCFPFFFLFFRCFSDQSLNLIFLSTITKGRTEMLNEGESTDMLKLLREMREEIRLEMLTTVYNLKKFESKSQNQTGM